MYLIIGIVLILFVIILISIDLLFIPSFILTVLSLLGFVTYLIYVFDRIDQITSWKLILIFIVTISIYLWLILKFKIWKLISLSTKLNNQNLHIDQIETLIHKRGTSISDLKPGGKILIEGKQYDAVTKTGFIAQDESIIVVGRLGSQVQVSKEI